MIAFKEKNVDLLHEIPHEIKCLSVLGNQVRLQLVLSEFLLNLAYYAPSHGWVEIEVLPAVTIKQEGENPDQLQLRMTHTGMGIPSGLVHDMFEEEINKLSTEERLGPNKSHKLLKLMNGNVC